MSDVATETAPLEPVSPAGTVLPHAGVAPTYTGLGVVAIRSEEQQAWIFGVNLGGVFVELVRRKLGGIDDDLQEAATPGFKQNRWDLAVKNGLVKP
jgi:hypothetical protein